MLGKAISDPLLGLTARWMASVRAQESLREDHLFDDPWAALLAGEAGEAWITQQSADSVIPIVLRTRFFDDFLQRISVQHSIRQIVLMAAGLDTRAFRLGRPENTRLFELDLPAVLQYKEGILRAVGAQPACVRHTIGVDLATPWTDSLIKAGFDPQQPSGWLLEGLLFYLPDDIITRLLDVVSRLAAHGSWMGFDIINRAMLTSPITQRWIEMQAKSGAPWIGTMDDPEGFVAARGWKATLSQAGAQDANHDRWPYPVIPTTMPGIPHNWFVIAHKQESSSA